MCVCPALHPAWRTSSSFLSSFPAFLSSFPIFLPSFCISSRPPQSPRPVGITVGAGGCNAPAPVGTRREQIPPQHPTVRGEARGEVRGTGPKCPCRSPGSGSGAGSSGFVLALKVLPRLPVCRAVGCLESVSAPRFLVATSVHQLNKN